MEKVGSLRLQPTGIHLMVNSLVKLPGILLLRSTNLSSLTPAAMTLP